jgi:hypothetical protein
LPVSVPEDNAVAAFAADAPVRVELAVDDQVHTTTSVRSGTVLAAVTGTTRPPAGFNSRPLGAMRHLAAASPAYVARHFALGIGAGSLSRAPCLIFNAKDDLQARWVRRLCHRDVELPRYAVPSAHAFVTAALAGMGRGLHPHELIAPLLANGSLVALVPDTALDVPLYWQHARAASSLSGSGSGSGYDNDYDHDWRVHCGGPGWRNRQGRRLRVGQRGRCRAAPRAAGRTGRATASGFPDRRGSPELNAGLVSRRTQGAMIRFAVIYCVTAWQPARH